METENPLSSWQVEEELTADGMRHLYIRVPGAASVSDDLQVLIQRGMEPPFLSTEGWGYEALSFAPEHLSRDGQDLLIQLSDDYTDHIDDFEPIDLQIKGTEFQGGFPWVLEPHRKIYPDEPGEEATPSPQVSFRASQSLVHVGRSVELIWESQHANTLQASGDWQGAKALQGKEVITLSDAGKKEFILDAVGQGGVSVASVVVQVSAATPSPPGPGTNLKPKYRWLIPLVAVLILLLLLGLLWFSSKDNGGGSTANEGTTTESTTTENTPVGGTGDSSNGGNHGCLSNPNASGCKPIPEMDPFEQLKSFIANKQYNEARDILDVLTMAGNHPGAALIAAENLGDPNFIPGLFDERNNNVALKYYRIACEGGVGARSSLELWQQKLTKENQQLRSAALKSMIEDKVPVVLQNCKS